MLPSQEDERIRYLCIFEKNETTNVAGTESNRIEEEGKNKPDKKLADGITMWMAGGNLHRSFSTVENFCGTGGQAF